MSLLILTLLVLALLTSLSILLVWRRAKKGPLQFSLRGFLVVVALIALGLASVIGYRTQTMAHLNWIDITSPIADKFFPDAVVSIDSNGKYQFTYCAKRRTIQKMLGSLSQLNNMSYKIDRESIEVKVEDEATVNRALAGLKLMDTVPPGTFVIRGKVIDRNGDPLAGATVDLMGTYTFINYFQTRDDGTFTMPLTDAGAAPAGGGYYLCVRSKKETATKYVRWNTPYFSLTPGKPELVVLITVPM